MRKRTINHFFDNFMWYLVYLLPLIIFIILLCNGDSDISISTVLTNYKLDTVQNVIINSFSDVLGADGVFALFNNNDLLLYFVYFISVYICHIFIDIVLFIPRYAHRIIGEKND